MVVFLLGLISLSNSGFIPQYASAILIVAGLLILTLFFVYDIKWAKAKIFSREIWNKTLIVSEVILLLNCVANYGERYFNSYELGINLKVTHSTIGYLLSVCGISVFFFSPITNILQRRLISKITLQIFFGLYSVVLLLDAMSIRYFSSVALYVICTFLNIGFYVGVIIVCQSYNYAQSPPRYSQQIGVLNALMQALGQSLGVALAVVIQTAIDRALQNNGENSPTRTFFPATVSLTLLCFIILLCVGFVLSFFLGVFRFERGKKGFREQYMQRTKTF